MQKQIPTRTNLAVDFFKRYANDQRGRSMTEVLAVLALIGILSVGALSGYKWAINKHHSNILTTEILQRGADLEMKLDRINSKLSLEKWDANSQLGYPIFLIDTTNAQKVAIQVDNVAKRICQMTFDNTSSANIYTEVNGRNSADACQNTNSMVFYFERPLTLDGPEKVVCVSPKTAVNNTCVCDPSLTPEGADPDTCLCPTGEEDQAGTCVPTLLEKCEAYCRMR